MQRVLVVDDDASIREVVAEVLGEHGYGVVEARDGLDALFQAKAWRPDLIVLDLMMPRMDGWEFRHQQELDPALVATPVIIISAYRPGRLAVPECAARLEKPFDLAVFLKLVDDLLRGPGAPRGGRGPPARSAA